MHRASYYLTLLLPLLPPANKVCEGYVFTGVCLSTGGLALCPGGSPSGGSLFMGVSVQGSLSRGGFLSKGISVQRGVCPGVSVRGSLSTGVSVWGSLSRGSLSGGSLSRGVYLPGSVQLRTGDTHPTVMHSCYSCLLCVKISHDLWWLADSFLKKHSVPHFRTMSWKIGKDSVHQRKMYKDNRNNSLAFSRNVCSDNSLNG